MTSSYIITHTVDGIIRHHLLNLKPHYRGPTEKIIALQGQRTDLDTNSEENLTCEEGNRGEEEEGEEEEEEERTGASGRTVDVRISYRDEDMKDREREKEKEEGKELIVWV